jgi:outer membrane lipoprotein LolB
VAALFDWLRGRPWPESPSAPLPEPARGFAQLGWQIDLSRFDEGLLLARRNAEPVVQLRARLAP